MRTSTFMKAFSVAAALAAAPSFATGFEKVDALKASAAKAERKEVKTEKKSSLVDSLKGATETTQLPKTARSEDARGGVFI